MADADKPEHKINIFIDRVKFETHTSSMTGAELRALPTPPVGTDRDLFLDLQGPGDDAKIGDTETVQLKNGMHFYTAPKTINPGDEHRIPEADETYLSGKQYSWELLPVADGACLVLKGVTVSAEKYSASVVDLMIRVPHGYPMAALDMFYVDPPLMLKSGGYPASADQFEEHGGRRWQRFSRHLPTPWRPGLDGLPMFLNLILPELQGKR
jgi:hypothetical protein